MRVQAWAGGDAEWCICGQGGLSWFGRCVAGSGDRDNSGSRDNEVQQSSRSDHSSKLLIGGLFAVPLGHAIFVDLGSYS